MRKRIETVVLSGVLLVAAAATGGGPARADDDERIERKVRVEVVEDGQAEKNVVFVHADGTAERVHGDHPVVWVGRDGYGFRFGSGTFLGVEMTRLTPELRSHFGVPEDRGVLVARVVEDSPAARAGLRTGDILTAVDGKAVDSTGNLVEAISSREEGDRVRVEVWRDGHPLELDATLAKRERSFEGPMRRVLRKACEDGADCEGPHAMERHRLYSEELCGDLSECEIVVRCEDDGCTCKVNGEEATCPESMK